jgi:hypothetical protein
MDIKGKRDRYIYIYECDGRGVDEFLAIMRELLRSYCSQDHMRGEWEEQ